MSIRPGTGSTTPSTRTGAALYLERLRRDAPLVQCITNQVVTNFTANVLLAQGASPAMTDLPGEAGMFARLASAVLINLGTPTAEQRGAAREAAAVASESGTPWVLDPVAIGVLPVRTALAAELVELRPTVIRGNPSEIMALAGNGAGGRGVDSVAGAEEALDAGRHLARRYGSIVAISGPIDIVTDGERVARLANGDRLLTVVTGGGCALGATIAAYLAVADGDVFEATVAAVTNYTVAAEVAADAASGPGSFAVAFIDALHALDAAAIADRANRS